MGSTTYYTVREIKWFEPCISSSALKEEPFGPPAPSAVSPISKEILLWLASINVKVQMENPYTGYGCDARAPHPRPTPSTKFADAKRWTQMTEGRVIEDLHLPSTKPTRHTVGETTERYLREILPHMSTNTRYNQRYQLQ